MKRTYKLRALREQYEALELPMKILVWVIGAGALLRLVGITYGLPYFFVGHEWELVNGPRSAVRSLTFFPGYLRQGHLFFNILIPQHIFLSGIGSGFLLFWARLNVVVFAVLTVVFTFLIGRRLMGRNAGIIAATLMAFDHLHVVWSHYARIDIPAAFFLLLMVWQGFRLLEEPSKRNHCLFGLTAGLSIAGKFPQAVFSAPFFAGIYLLGFGKELFKNSQLLKHGLLAGLLVPAGFFIGMPYALIKFPEFIGVIQKESAMAGTELAWYPRLFGFFENLWVYLFSDFYNMRASISLRQSFGVPLLALTVLGLIWTFIKPRRQWLILVFSTLIYVAFILSNGKPNTRWFLAVLPVFALTSTYFIEFILQTISRRKKSAYLYGALVILGFVLALPLARNFYFDFLSLRKDSRIVAKDWLKENVNSQSIIGHLANQQFYPPRDKHYKLRLFEVETRNFDNAIANDVPPEINSLKNSDVDYFMLSDEVAQWYTSPEFIRKFPETAKRYAKFFDGLSTQFKKVYESPTDDLRPGPVVTIYQLK